MDGTMHPASGPMHVLPVACGAQTRQFVRYPFARYGRPDWVPPLLLAVEEQIARKYTFFEHARVELFLVSTAIRASRWL